MAELHDAVSLRVLGGVLPSAQDLSQDRGVQILRQRSPGVLPPELRRRPYLLVEVHQTQIFCCDFKLQWCLRHVHPPLHPRRVLGVAPTHAPNSLPVSLRRRS